MQAWRAGHADGVANGPDERLVYAAGNYTIDKSGYAPSAWTMEFLHGYPVESWEDAVTNLVLTPPDDVNRPLLVEEGLNGGPAIFFDHTYTYMDLAERQVQPRGRTVLWVGRTSYFVKQNEEVPSTWPQYTVVGDSNNGINLAQVGLTEGKVICFTQGGANEATFGLGYSDNQASTRCLAVTHAVDGTAIGYADGKMISSSSLPYPLGPDTLSWFTVGSPAGTPPNGMAFGLFGAVVVMDRIATPYEIAKIHLWAQGRFGCV